MLHLYGQVELEIGCGKTIKELLTLGKYSSVCPDVNDVNFPVEYWEDRILGRMLFKIFRTKKAMEFEDVILSLYRGECRGASLRHGLAFGSVKPHIHQKISLCLPGSSWRNLKTAFGMRQIPELFSISGSRHVYLRQMDCVYPTNTFFLATPLSYYV